jgi:hypothetical protein
MIVEVMHTSPAHYIYTKALNKKISLLLTASLFTVLAHAQKEVSVDSLKNHIGDSVKVCTKIYGGIYLDRSKGTPTLLNAGAAYPNAPLTLFIRADARKTFKEAPEVFYKDKEVCICGRVRLYKDKPEIEVYDEKQLVVQ